MKKDLVRLAYLIVTFTLITGFTYPESNRGWKSATLDISAKRLDAMEHGTDNAHTTTMELYGSRPEQTTNESNHGDSESFDDEYHMNRYFSMPISFGIRIPKDTKGILLIDPGRKIRTDDFEYKIDDATGLPKFTFFHIIKKTIPGSAFGLPDAENVVFWVHRRYFGGTVFLVEIFLKGREAFESLEKHLDHKYGEGMDDAFGRGKLVSIAYIWNGEDASIRLLETRNMLNGLEPESTFSLAFIDTERTEGVLVYLHTLMRLAPEIGVGTRSPDTR